MLDASVQPRELSEPADTADPRRDGLVVRAYPARVRLLDVAAASPIHEIGTCESEIVPPDSAVPHAVDDRAHVLHFGVPYLGHIEANVRPGCLRVHRNRYGQRD